MPNFTSSASSQCNCLISVARRHDRITGVFKPFICYLFGRGTHSIRRYWCESSFTMRALATRSTSEYKLPPLQVVSTCSRRQLVLQVPRTRTTVGQQSFPINGLTTRTPLTLTLADYRHIYSSTDIVGNTDFCTVARRAVVASVILVPECSHSAQVNSTQL